MIKMISSMALAGLVAVTMTGCGAEPKPKVEEAASFACKQENVLAPKWTCIPMVEGAYAGVGIADKSAAGTAHMRRVALANGRSDLTQQIQTQVKDKVTAYTGVTGNGNAEVIDKVSKAVTSQVAKVDLQGSKAVDMWNAPSGAMYLLVTVPESDVNGAVKDTIQKTLKSSFKNDDARWQQFQSKQALDDLNKEFPTD
ncbi:MAG: LPP20 family lipoprotein [Campylobacterota bacterium]|nr:LPP20 family lipoprotein [Campylobacterota bacterium]